MRFPLAYSFAAVLALAWGLADPRFHSSDGFFAADVCLPLALAAALVCLALAARGDWFRSGCWFAIGLVGQACTLQLFSIGPVVAYPVYSFSTDAGPNWIPLLGFGTQAAAVTWGLLPSLRQALGWLCERVGMIRLGLLGAITLATAAAFFTDMQSWAAKSAFGTAIQLVHIATLFVAVRALPNDALGRLASRADRWLGPRDGDVNPAGLDRFAWVLAAFAAGCAALLCWFVYERHPHVPDEVVYMIHGDYFARGLLSLPRPPVPAAFDIDLMLLDGARWFCPVPPGWPAALSVGAFFGAAWLVNPILTGVDVLLAYVLLREISNQRAARLATLLLAASPWFIFMGMSYMPHPFPMAAGLLAALGVARARRGSAAWGWLAGGCLGVVALVRPLEGLVIALVLGLWGIGWGGTRLRVPALVGLVLGAIAVGSIAVPYNTELSGSATKFPIMKYIDTVYGEGKNELGFGPDRGLGWGGLDPFPGHDLVDAAINAQFNLFAINTELHGWGAGSSLALLLLLLLGGLRRLERMMLVPIVMVVGAHTFYWFAGGPDFGARYWYFILLPCVVLTAGGIRRLGELLAQDSSTTSPIAHGRALAAAAALSVFAWTTFMPWRITDKYHNYRGMRPDVRELASSHDLGNSLVLVRGKRTPDYASAAIYNPLDLDAPTTIYAWDKDMETRAQLLAHYAGRSIWILEGPSITGDGYLVVAGPMTATELQER